MTTVTDPNLDVFNTSLWRATFRGESDSDGQGFALAEQAIGPRFPRRMSTFRWGGGAGAAGARVDEVGE